ncbi:MAG: hypothetical protein P0Y66_17665 [Candidatus Kaistia colombiensis]|nr:MAG: hypothetical protein P0Y66_17665 [Kaistia sp.]
MLSTSCRREFMNYDAFYAGIGVDERVFSDDFPAALRSRRLRGQQFRRGLLRGDAAAHWSARSTATRRRAS